MIEIIPAIDIIDGRCVRLTKGDFSAKKVYDASPLDMVLQYADCGVRRIHVVDLDGARRSKPINLATLEQIATKSEMEIEWGGGVADDSSLASVFNAGATQAIVGSVAALRPASFSRWLRIFGPERMLLGADVKDGVIAVKGWEQSTGLTLDEQIGWFLEDGLKYVVCTDISKDGLLQGPSFDLYASLMDEFQSIIFTASGGVSCMKDIEELNRIGVPKVVVGKAIYEGKITLEDIGRWSLNA